MKIYCCFQSHDFNFNIFLIAVLEIILLSIIHYHIRVIFYRIMYCFLNISLYTNFAIKKYWILSSTSSIDIENELVYTRILIRWMKGCQKEQSRNIISESDGKIIATSTVGLTVGDWNFSPRPPPPEVPTTPHMHTHAQTNAKHPNVHVPNEFTFTPKLRQNINDGPLMAFPFDVREKRVAAVANANAVDRRGGRARGHLRNSPQSPR